MSERQYAIFMMLISALGFSAMAIFVRLAGDVPAVQKSVFRSATIMLISSVVLVRTGHRFKDIKRYDLLAIRVIAGTVGIVLNYYAIDHLILSDANVIFRISAVLVLIFSWLFLGESFTRIQFIATVVAFIGVAIVAKPSFDISFIPYVIALIGATAAAIAYTSLRAMGGHIPPSMIVFLFSTFTTLVLTPYVLLNAAPMRYEQWLYLILAGVCAAIGQYGITIAYKHAPASEVSIYNYFGVIFTMLLAMLILGQFPDPSSYIGYVLIFVSSYLLYRYNNQTN